MVPARGADGLPRPGGGGRAGRARRPGARATVTTEDGRLVGVLSGADVTHALESSGCVERQPEPAARGPGLLVWAVVAVVLLGAGAALYHPPYVVIAPGRRPTSAATSPSAAPPPLPSPRRYLLTSVGWSAPAGWALLAALRTDRDVVPVGRVLPKGVDPASTPRVSRRYSRRAGAWPRPPPPAGRPCRCGSAAAGPVVEVLPDSQGRREERTPAAGCAWSSRAADGSPCPAPGFPASPAGSASAWPSRPVTSGSTCRSRSGSPSGPTSAGRRLGWHTLVADLLERQDYASGRTIVTTGPSRPTATSARSEGRAEGDRGPPGRRPAVPGTREHLRRHGTSGSRSRGSTAWSRRCGSWPPPPPEPPPSRNSGRQGSEPSADGLPSARPPPPPPRCAPGG